MSDHEITEQSPDRETGNWLTYGPLTLDLDTRILTGPLGWVILRASDFDMVLALMKPALVSLEDLLTVAFPPDTQQPRRPQHALTQRLLRLRTSLEQVGVSGDAIRCFPRQGYGLGLGGVPARTYTGKQVRMLDALLASHPDREAVAALG